MVVVVEVVVVRVPVGALLVTVGTEVVEVLGSAAIAVGAGTGVATGFVEAVVGAGALAVVVLVAAGTTVMVPLFAVDDVLLRRVSSWLLLDTGMVDAEAGAVEVT